MQTCTAVIALTRLRGCRPRLEPYSDAIQPLYGDRLYFVILRAKDDMSDIFVRLHNVEVLVRWSDRFQCRNELVAAILNTLTVERQGCPYHGSLTMSSE